MKLNLSWAATHFTQWKRPQKAGDLQSEVAFVINDHKTFWPSGLKTEGGLSSLGPFKTGSTIFVVPFRLHFVMPQCTSNKVHVISSLYHEICPLVFTNVHQLLHEILKHCYFHLCLPHGCVFWHGWVRPYEIRVQSHHKILSPLLHASQIQSFFPPSNFLHCTITNMALNAFHKLFGKNSSIADLKSIKVIVTGSKSSHINI